jgi:chaperonin GroES
MSLKPLADRIVVLPEEISEKTSGGIYLPSTATKEKPVLGKVIAVGPGKFDKKGNRIALEVSKGDKVVYSKWAGTEVVIDDKKYLLMKEDDILAIAN